MVWSRAAAARVRRSRKVHEEGVAVIKIHYVPPSPTAPLTEFPHDHPARFAPTLPGTAYQSEQINIQQGARSTLVLEGIGKKGRIRRNQRDSLKLSEEWQELAGKSGQFDGLLRTLHDATTCLDKDGRPNLSALKNAQRQLRQWFFSQSGGSRGNSRVPLAGLQEQVAKVDSLLGRVLRRNLPLADEGENLADWGTPTKSVGSAPGDSPLLARILGFFRPVSRDAQHLHQQGLKLWVAGHTEQALDHLEEAADKAPKNAQIQHDLGQILAEEGYYPAAEWALMQAATLRPRSAAVQSALGDLYSQMGQNDMAIEAFKQALVRDAQYTDAHAQLGVVFYELGQLAEAAPHLQKAVALDQQCVVARFYLAQVSLQLNDVLRARYQLGMVAKLDPSMDLERFSANEPPALMSQSGRPEATIYRWKLPRSPAIQGSRASLAT